MDARSIVVRIIIISLFPVRAQNVPAGYTTGEKVIFLQAHSVATKKKAGA
jgi:hypothetical protein